MITEIEKGYQELRDRQEIYDCLIRYCRGIDRLDREVVASAYHEDAIDDHGAYVGPVSGFIDWAFALHSEHQQRTQHMITNHRCELDGDRATTESYYIFRSLNVAAPFHTMATGRYLDRFERRDGRWGISERICLVDIRDDHLDPEGKGSDAPFQQVTRDRADPSYQLVIGRERFTV